VSCFVGTALEHHSVNYARTTAAYPSHYAPLFLAADLIRLERPPKT
jgi:hypothetical protein